MTRVVTLSLILFAACAADEAPRAPEAVDAGAYDPEPARDASTSQPDASAPSEPDASDEPSPEPEPEPEADAAPVEPSPEPDAAVEPDASEPEPQPEPDAGVEPQPEPDAGVEPEPEPTPQPARFCKLSTGQRFAGHTIGCDDESRRLYTYFSLSWHVPSSEAASGHSTVGCAIVESNPCATGTRCWVDDTRKTIPRQEGICQ